MRRFSGCSVTGTEVGLPNSPVIDTQRNLTPEWLYALGRIETLDSLKKEQERIGQIDLQAIRDEVAKMEAAFDEMLLTVRPNIAILSDIPTSEVPDLAGAGVPHGLGTDNFIANWRDPGGTGGLTPVQGGVLQKTPSVWTFSGSLSTGSYFTFTALV